MTNTRTPSRIVPRAFPGITPDEVEELISKCKINSYPTGAVLCRENNIERTFYMILDGEVEVSKVINNSESRLLKTLGVGDFFGEMALIHNAPRAATVAAKTPLVVLELDQSGFDQVLKRSSSIALAMVREISSRLRQNDEMAIEDLRMRARELADAYQKLAEQELARREFLGSVAHELRTPLMTASGYLQILQKGVLNGDKLTEVINIVSRNVGQIVELVNDVLFLQEIELVLPEFQPVDMLGIVRLVFNRYEEKAGAQQTTLKTRGEQYCSQVAGDPKSLERAIMALVDNAIKFSPRGGDVEICFDATDEDVIIAIQDHGIGIAPEILPRVFDRFYHVDRSEDDVFGGVGIGLAITRQVISQHHGTISVESVSGNGSTFTITLPKWAKRELELGKSH
jgi:signal transduction histidine kinase